MFVHDIQIHSFRHLENVRIGPFAPTPDASELVVLAGPNGGGKSSILELLGYALSNTWSLQWALRRSFPQNSFEVAIGLTPDERILVKQYIESTGASYGQDVLEHLEQSGVYYRAYNMTGGQYQEHAPLYNKIHSLVTTALRNHYGRSLGFFLKSDRYYPPEAFRRDTFFSGRQLDNREHLWQMAFNTSDLQYQDMLEFLILQRYHYLRRLGAYHHRIAEGDDPGSKPVDPLKPYDELLQRLFPNYRFADIDDDVPKNLFVQIPSGESITFSDLSSGEKEVFFILSFFIRHNVSNAVIVIDEPEMHLHPELARILVRSMQRIKPGNQLWLATHNPEIIDEAGRDRVVYIARNQRTSKCEATPATEEAEVITRLKDLLGYSGYVGVARNVVFLEGVDSSSDRRLFSALFPETEGHLKFIPCKSSEDLPRMNAAVLSILESNVGWMRFFLIRDHDYLTPVMIDKYRAHSSGRLFVLDRYHIENYLLDCDLIADVQASIFSQPTTADKVKSRLRTVARRIAGEVLRDMMAFRLNQVFRPHDFSLGKIFQGEVIVSEGGDWQPDKLDHFEREITERAESAARALAEHTTVESINARLAECREEISTALSSQGDKWMAVFPGRRLLEEYARMERLGKPIVLQNSLIKALGAHPDRIPIELRNIIQGIVDRDE